MSETTTTAAPAAKEDLVAVVHQAFDKTGPENLRAALVKLAERVQAVEALLA